MPLNSIWFSLLIATIQLMFWPREGCRVYLHKTRDLPGRSTLLNAFYLFHLILTVQYTYLKGKTLCIVHFKQACKIYFLQSQKGTKQLPLLLNSWDELSKMLSFQKGDCNFAFLKNAKACLWLTISKYIGI